MRKEDNEYQKAYSKLYEYAYKNHWSHTRLHNWLRANTEPYYLIRSVKQLIGEL